MADEKKRTSWIYLLKKEELIKKMDTYNLDNSGPNDELRKRLSEFVRENPKLNELGALTNTEDLENVSGPSSSLSSSSEAQNTINLQETITEMINRAMEQIRIPPQAVILPPPEMINQGADYIPPNPQPPQHQLQPDAEIMEKMRRWNIHYDGGNDALDFLERIEELAAGYDVPRDHLPRILPDKLRNRALEWFRTNSNNNSTSR